MYQSNFQAVFISSTPLSISGFSVLYITPNIPVQADHRITRIHSHPKKKETVRCVEMIPRMMKIKAETADREPTTTAYTCHTVSISFSVWLFLSERPHPF